MNASDQPEQPAGARKMTPTERLHDLAMASITKTATVRGSESVSVKQVHMGPKSGQWICDGITVIPQDGETMMQAWSRTYDLARQVQRDLIDMNAAIVGDELSATLEKSRGATTRSKA